MGALLSPTSDNYVQKTLDAQLLAGATTVTLNNTTGIPNLPGAFIVDRINSNDVETPSSREVISYTGVSGSTLTGLTRNADGSGSDQDHAVNAIVEFGPDVLWAQSIYDALANLVVVSTGAVDTTKVVTPAGTQTLTNKTLTSPVVNVTSDAQGDVYYRSAAGLFTRLAPGISGQVLQTQGADANPQWSSIGQAVIVSTENGTYSSGATNFIYPCNLSSPFSTESSRQSSFPTCTLKALRFHVSANSLNNNLIITVRKAGSDTSLTKTVDTTVTGHQLITTDVAVTANDLISIKIDTSAAGSGSATILSMMLIYQL